jgi:hypothetical protein
MALAASFRTVDFTTAWTGNVYNSSGLTWEGLLWQPETLRAENVNNLTFPATYLSCTGAMVLDLMDITVASARSVLAPSPLSLACYRGGALEPLVSLRINTTQQTYSLPVLALSGCIRVVAVRLWSYEAWTPRALSFRCTTSGELLYGNAQAIISVHPILAVAPVHP